MHASVLPLLSSLFKQESLEDVEKRKRQEQVEQAWHDAKQAKQQLQLTVARADETADTTLMAEHQVAKEEVGR